MIAALTGVRAIMGLWVIADHVFPPMVKLLPAMESLRFVLSGGIALDTFFILSGFIISHAYAQRLVTIDRRRYRAFVWARFTRVYPTHLFALLLMAAMLPVVNNMYGQHFAAASNWSVWTFLGNLLMLHAVPGIEPWNAPSWAVSTEFAAYLIFPFAAAKLVGIGRRTAIVVAVVLIGVLVVMMSALMSSTAPTLVAVWWVRPLGEFMLGCLLWAAWRHGVQAHWRWDAVAAAAFGGVLLVTWISQFGVPRFAAVPLLGVFVVAVANSAGPVYQLMNTRLVQWAGRTSYSRYILHAPVLVIIGLLLPVSVFAAYGPLPLRITLVLLWFVVTFAVGALAFRFIELPAQRWLRQRGDAWGLGRVSMPQHDGASTSVPEGAAR